MTVISRRTMLKLSAAGAGASVGVALTGPAFTAALGLPASAFQYGVASGDPLPTGIILWTRVTPDPAATPGSGLGAPTSVTWKVATDAALLNVVASGSVTTSPTSDHTVKVDVPGLAPLSTYYYGFSALGEDSPVGSFRTAPLPGTQLNRLRFGFVSCSNYEGGYFTPYRYLATRCDLDFVLHVGDYIYEYGAGGYGPMAALGRAHDPVTEIVTLEDYRRRHAIYKADPDLAELHRKFAWITTIDDHEVTNDTWSAGAENHQPGEGPYVDRRNAAYQAYLEWMPIRLDVPATPAETRLYRRFQFGQLADLLMLDLRQYRDQQGGAAEAYLAGRQMTGTDQYDWLTTQLADTTSHQWRLIGNSVQFMRVVYPFAGFAPNGDGTYRNFDAWDGYGTQRAALQSVLAGHASDYDAVFLTGDIHSTWASELPLWSGAGAPTGGSVGVEFVCTSVTSDNLNEILGQPPRNPTSLFLEGGILSANPHIKLLEFDSHGCSVVEVTDAYTQCDWYYTSDRTSNTATVSHAFSYRTMAGTKTVAAAPGRIVDDCLPPVEVPEFSGPAVLPLVAVAGVGAALALRRRAEQPATA